VKAAAGAGCSSLRVELMALREALRTVVELPADERRPIRHLCLFTDSRSGLQLLMRGPTGQCNQLAVDVWRLLTTLGDAGTNASRWAPPRRSRTPGCRWCSGLCRRDVLRGWRSARPPRPGPGRPRSGPVVVQVGWVSLVLSARRAGTHVARARRTGLRLGSARPGGVLGS